MKESTHVYDLLKRNYPLVHWQRIENVAGTGVPDVNGCIDHIEFWIETKIAKAGAFNIRPDQVAWHTKRVNKGGRAFVLVREDDTLTLYRADGKGSWTFLAKTQKPFNYQILMDIILYTKF